MGGKRTENQLGIRLSNSERADVEKAAAKDHRKAADWARLLILDAAAASKPAPAREPGDEALLQSIKVLGDHDASLPEILIALGRSAMRQPPLARALKELAQIDEGGAPGEIEGRSRKGRPRR